MTLVQKYVSNLPNFTSPIKSSRFGKVPYNIVIHGHIAAGQQTVIITELTDSNQKNKTAKFDVTSPVLPGNHFTAFNVPMTTLGFSNSPAPNPVITCQLNANTNEQYMVTSLLSGCAFAIYKQNQDLYVCHILPSPTHSINVGNPPVATPINAVNLGNLITNGDMPIHNNVGPLPPQDLVAIYSRNISAPFVKPARVTGQQYIAGSYAQKAAVVSYKKNGKWIFLVQSLQNVSSSTKKLMGSAVLYRQP